MATKKPLVILIVAVVLALVAGAAWLTRDSWTGLLPGGRKTEEGFRVFEKGGVKYRECYVCPMHPEVVKPKPGSCPICGMDLIRKDLPLEEQKPEPEQAMTGTDAEGYRVFEKGGVKYRECYVCPMHPSVVRPTQEGCPICGMDLIKKELPLEREKHAPESGAGPGGMDMGTAEQGAMSAAEKKKLSGLMKISLDPRQRVLANVATSKVVYEDISTDVYTVGRVELNEDTIEKAAAWFPGRIERMYVTYAGQVVRRGERIMSVYSPELVATQKEYLVARASAARLSNSGFPEITSGTKGVVEAARTRMKLWGVTDEQIQRLEQTGVPDGMLDVYSKVAGTVTMITAREGGYVKEGSELFTVADLGSVWVNAEVYEYEFSKVSSGAQVEITADAYPGRTFHGKVSFIDPVVDNQSRTVHVRSVIQNPSGMLKPEMFVDAKIMGRPKHVLTVPASAVLYTGRREIVWVETAPGEYEPRQVELGLRSGDSFEVLAGLSEGDTAVTQGGFLIDSEAQLRMSAGSMSMPGMDMGGEPKASGDKEMDMGGHAGHQH